MALSIRRGTTRVLVITLDGCTSDNYLWPVFDNSIVRLTQGNVVIDKEIVPLKSDFTTGLVAFSQKDTLQLNSTYKARLQIASLKETPDHQSLIKTPVFEINVEPSLWDEEITNDKLIEESLDIENGVYPDPIGHIAYEYLHLKIDEYSGIIAERGEAIIEGSTLYVDPNTETLYSE